MVRKKYTWRKMDAIFMYWPQFEQLVRDRLQSVLSRNVQLHIFEDTEYWEVITDEFTSAEMEKLLSLGNVTEKERKLHAPKTSGRIKDINDTLVLKLLQPMLPLQVKKTVPTEDGLYLFGQATSVTHEYDEKGGCKCSFLETLCRSRIASRLHLSAVLAAPAAKMFETVSCWSRWMLTALFGISRKAAAPILPMIFFGIWLS